MLLAYGDGFGRACSTIFANFGTKLMILVPDRTSLQAGGQKAGAPIRFTLEDVDALTTNLPQITHITPEVSKDANVQFDTRTFQFSVTGNYANVEAVRAIKIRGTPITCMTRATRARAVIGSDVKDNFSPAATRWENSFVWMA
jgi:putative ABC transport system permease protein